MNDKSLWMLRPKPHYKNRMKEFLDDSIIAIGWPKLGDMSKLNKEQIKEKYEANYEYKDERQLNFNSNMINNFVNNIQKGDIVLIPDDDYLYLFEVLGDYYYDVSKAPDNIGYPHQHKVELVKKVLRDNLPDSLKNGLKTRFTLSNFKNHRNEISEIIQGKPIDGNLLNTTSTTFSETISAKYPLRNNLLVNIEVPYDITKEEAERLGDFVKTLYFN